MQNETPMVDRNVCGVGCAAGPTLKNDMRGMGVDGIGALEARRAFSLIEMMIVIVIIAIVTALVVPALGKARDVAKDTDTRTLLNSVSQSASQFSLDHNGNGPGYFSALEMAQTDNGVGGEGFSGMQNAMLDLAGGALTKAPGDAVGPEEIVVGPFAAAAKNVVVDTRLIGAGKTDKAYFVPSAKNFKKQDGTDGAIRGADASGNSSASTGNITLPELVDARGQPILWWASNSSAIGPSAPFAADTSNSGSGDGAARVYWNPNAVFVSSSAVGAKNINNLANSALNDNNANKLTTLTALMGNPNSPVNALATPAMMKPSAARGTALLHAAGRDGVYLSATRGPRRMLTDVDLAMPENRAALKYATNFYQVAPPDERRLDGDRKRSSIDVLADFDDIITAID